MKNLILLTFLCLAICGAVQSCGGRMAPAGVVDFRHAFDSMQSEMPLRDQAPCLSEHIEALESAAQAPRPKTNRVRVMTDPALIFNDSTLILW